MLAVSFCLGGSVGCAGAVDLMLGIWAFVGYVPDAMSFRFRVPRCRFILVLHCSLLSASSSSRRCIRSSAIFARVEAPIRLRSLVSVLPKTLKSLSHDAEFAVIERTRFANCDKSVPTGPLHMLAQASIGLGRLRS